MPTVASRETVYRARLCEEHSVEVVKTERAGWMGVSNGGPFQDVRYAPTRAEAEDAVLDDLGVPTVEPMTLTTEASR